MSPSCELAPVRLIRLLSVMASQMICSQHFVTDVQRFERGLHQPHIMCAVRDEEFTEHAVKGRALVKVQATATPPHVLC